MTTKELMFIKRYQRDFKDTFGVPLIIDFPKMNGEEVKEYPKIPSLQLFLEESCERHGIDLADIRDRRYIGRAGNKGIGLRVKDVLREYSKYVIKEGFNYKEAAKLIGRDRSLISYYGEL